MTHISVINYRQNPSRNIYSVLLKLLLFLSLLPGPALVFGQSETTTVVGTVVDAGGGIIAGATVTLQTPGRPDVTTTTNSEGRFRLETPSSGVVSLLVSYAGFASRTLPVTLVNGSVVTVDVKLDPLEVRQTVTVTESVAVIGTSGTKTDTPLIETPQAISIVNRPLLMEQNARKLDDVLRNVAGVKAGGYYADWDYYRIRGFDASFTTYLDGLRGDGGPNEEILGLERVEVVRGPTSSLFGQGPPGGLVNLASKRPQPDFFADGQVTFGSYKFFEPAMDIGGSLNGSNTLYARLNTVYRSQGSFVDYVKKDRLFVAPSVTWEIRPKTTVTFLSRHMHDWNELAFPLPAKGTALPNINGEIPVSRFVGEPDSPNYVKEFTTQVGYEFKHQFNEDFSFRQSLRNAWGKSKWDEILYPAFLDADERTLYRYPYTYRNAQDSFRIDTAVDKHFRTGHIRHHLVVGIDYFRDCNDGSSRQIDYADPANYTPIDLFNPIYGSPIPELQPATTFDTRNGSTGIYFQEQARLTEQLIVTLGGRGDFSSSDEKSVKAFTPRVGASYQFRPGMVVYGNFSGSFQPQWSYVDSAGKTVHPERGQNREIGLKNDLLSGRLSTTFAFFQLTRQNVATSDLSTPDPFDSIVSGEQRSRGIEIEGALRLAENCSLTTAYSYTNAIVALDNTLPVGDHLINVPDHNFNVWTKYTLRNGTFKGLGVGGGGRYYSDQAGDMPNTFRLPSYGLADAGVFYEHGRFHTQINFNNLFNKRYFVGSYDATYVLPGEPFTVRATLGFRF